MGLVWGYTCRDSGLIIPSAPQEPKKRSRFFGGWCLSLWTWVAWVIISIVINHTFCVHPTSFFLDHSHTYLACFQWGQTIRFLRKSKDDRFSTSIESIVQVLWCQGLMILMPKFGDHFLTPHEQCLYIYIHWYGTLWLWLTKPWYRWPIEIDGLPNLKNVIFHGYVK